jgi:5-methylcytosine-specific restriction protein A
MAESTKVRNPDWSRDELILALDLYLANPSSPPGKTSAQVAELSGLLNGMGAALGVVRGEDYRNPTGVYMKLMNLRAHDPAYRAKGGAGLSRGGKGDAQVWADFGDDHERLRATAAAIRAAILAASSSGGHQTGSSDDGLAEAEEGRLLTRMHFARERSRKLVDALKSKRLAETGKLTCEVCDFDYEQTYGDRGRGYMEAHHRHPVHLIRPGQVTKLADLALLCANCHRMIHARRPWLTLDELRAHLVRA